MTKLYMITAWDCPDSDAKRALARDAHFIHIERAIGRIAIAGPLKTEAGGFSGSLFVIKADDVAEAQALFQSDPYFVAGVWNRWEIHPFVAAAGEWIGGKTW